MQPDVMGVRVALFGFHAASWLITLRIASARSSKEKRTTKFSAIPIINSDNIS
jgi:hypothetical protein